MAVDKRTQEPGGAANVLRNLASLGAKPYAFGVVGDDQNGEDLCRMLNEQSVDTNGIQHDSSRITTEKTRIIANKQQVVRVDTEKIEPLGETSDRRVAGQPCRRHFLRKNRCDHRGRLRQGHRHGNPAAAGMRCRIRTQYPHRARSPSRQPDLHAEGYTVITPNRAEAFKMAGMYEHPGVLPIEDDAALLGVVDILQEKWNPHAHDDHSWRRRHGPVQKRTDPASHPHPGP